MGGVCGKDDRRAEEVSPLRMIGMRVRKNNPLNAAVDRVSHCIEVHRISRARVNDPTTHHVGIRPVERQRRRIPRANALDPLWISVVNRHLITF